MSTVNSRFSFNGDGKHPEPQPDQRKKKLVEALDHRYKELNKLWEAAEADLKQVPIPVDVSFAYKSIPADPHNDPRGQVVRIHDLLGFVKSEGGWRICHGQSHDGFPDCEVGWTPINECTVALRVEAAAHLGKLRELVLKAAEECVAKLDDAIAELRGTLRRR
jgi:hypothetical protein